MTSWFILVITLWDAEAALIPQRGSMKCGQAMAHASEMMRVSHDVGTFMLQCKDTGIPLLRPVPRPEGLGR
jgi:hypothetical protein